MLSSLLLRHRGRACPEHAYESIGVAWDVIIAARTRSGKDVPGSAGFVPFFVGSGLQPGELVTL